MAIVTEQDVRHVAMLARLGLTDEQARSLARDLNTILAHMEVLSRVDTDAGPESAGIGAAGARLDKDHGTSAPLAERPEAFAPAMRGGFFLVPCLSSHEDSEGAA